MVAHQLASVYEVVSMARVEDGREMRSALIETGLAPLGQAAPDGNLIGLEGNLVPLDDDYRSSGDASQGEASSCRERAKPTSIMS